jgi:iron complex transport system substrate-binding protein
MKRLLTVVMIAVFAMALAACGKQSAEPAKQAATPSAEATATPAAQNEELTIKHKLGETKVKKNPQKVVVFDFGTLDTLDKLGVEVIGLPKSSLPPYLDKYKDDKYANLGTLKEPDFEKINELNPDLIIITGRTEPAYEEMSKIAPTIFVAIDNKNYMESFKNNATLMGQIFGKEDVVAKEIAQVEQSVKSVTDKVKATNANALILLTNDGKISGYGPGSRFGIIHDVLGFAPVDPNIEASTHGAGVSYEYIVEKNPEYLFVVDRTAAVDGKSSAKEIIENDLVKNTRAYKEGKIVYLDPNYWYMSGGGLVSVPEMIKEVEAGLK